MASFRKRGPYQWEARIRRKGYPVQCRTFETKQEALAWSAVIESEMARGMFVSRAEAEATTLKELLERYDREITPQKKGSVTEHQKINLLLKDKLADRIIATIHGKDIASFRDRRLKTVSASTVNRDLNLLGHVFSVAIQDWGINLPANPVQLVRRPKVPANAARDRRLQSGEEERLLAACRAHGGQWLESIPRLALETAMRRSELFNLRWECVHLKRNQLHIPDSKNETSRDVPLSSRAVHILESLPRSVDGRVFQFKSPDQISMKFSRACKRAQPEPINDLRFHDLRHEATSRLFEKGLNPMQVAAITGHKTLQMLKRYTHLRAEDLAKMLG